MGLLTNLILSFVHLFLVAIDLLFLLLLATMLSHQWQPAWLRAISSAGKPVVEWLTGQIERGLGRLGLKNSSEKTTLFIGMLAIGIIRILITSWLAR